MKRKDSQIIPNNHQSQKSSTEEKVSINVRKSLEEKIDYWRKKLLDLTKRNRLISFRDYRTSTLLLQSPDPLTTFNALFEKQEALFYKFDEGDEEVEGNQQQRPLFQRDHSLKEQRGGKKEGKEPPDFETLPSNLDPKIWIPNYGNKETERRLYNLYLKSQESLREQGINTLFVALGFLHYYEADHSDEELQTPLLLAPISIERQRSSFKDRHSYKITPLEDDIQLNPAIARKLLNEFNLELPEFSTEMDIKSWLDSVGQIIKGKEGWSITKDLCIGIFAFEKLQMYLDIERFKDRVFAHPILQILVGAPPELAGSFEGVPQREELDERVPPSEMNCVLDTDSSQQRAIEIAKKGGSFVIQGPPGTGKSQTIVNIIAELLAQKRRVLFVSAKMAALEVVKKRLDRVGLGGYCLELHSHRANKKQVMRQLEEQLGYDRKIKTTYSGDELYPELGGVRDKLNRLGKEMLKPRGEVGLSIYEARGNLAKLEDVPDIPYELDGILETTKEGLNQALTDLGNIEGHREEIINYKSHLWKDTTITQFGLDISDTLKSLLKELAADKEETVKLINKSGKNLGLRPKSMQSLEEALSLLQKLEERPNDSKLASKWFTRDLDQELKLLRTIADNTDKINTQAAHLLKHYRGDFLNLKVSKLLERFETDFASITRYIKREYWRERKKIIEFATTPRSFGEMRDDLRSLKELQKLTKEADKLIKKIRHILPKTYELSEINWHDLEDIVNWVHEIKSLTSVDLPSLLIKKIIKEDGSLAELLNDYTEIYERSLKPHFQKLIGYFEANFTRWDQPPNKADIYEVLGWITNLKGSLNKLRDWVEFNNHLDNLSDQLREYVEIFLSEGHRPEVLAEAYKKIFLKGFLSEAENKVTQLSGDHYADKVTRFRELDRELNYTTREKILHLLEQDKPHAEAFSRTGSSETAVLRREIRKERRHMPLRILLAKIPNLISALKPCFMMSPLSVAQYIDLEKTKPFDVVIFDEASQIMPEDAVSSIIRAKQAIIVGDSQQLPPTRFFTSLDEDFEIEEELEDLDSILDETSARLGEEYLRWHYRSRDESLITFSNRKFYENRLITFPNDELKPEGTGIEYIYVEDGIYDRGASRKNWKEADRVVELVKKHIETSPEKSLGVVAFSIQQQRAIQDRIEIFRRKHPKYADFFAEDILDEFFVKNLETVQGDERDVMIFSVGYGPDHAGKMTLNFGPINKQGGYKRLNVAITRAREKVYLVSSFQPESIDLEDVSNQGLRYLLQYMKYAKDGIDTIIGERVVSEIQALETDFEEAVYDKLTEHGWDLAAQVGTSSYRIDLAVKHPQQKGRFILGIECDGSAYHSSKTARDRDRIRQDVLENLGWNIHRIWSTDWLLDSEGEIAKIENKLCSILKNEGSMTKNVEKFCQPQRQEKSEVVEEVRGSAPPLQLLEYKVAELPKKRGGIKAFNNAWYGTFVKPILEAVKAESPIHAELLLRRVAGAWDIAHIGANVRRTLLAELNDLHRKDIVKKGNILWYKEKQKLVPTRISSEEQRPFNLIPPQELAWLAIELLKRGFSIEEDDLMFEMARKFGYVRRGSHIQKHLKETLKYLASIGKIKRVGKRIKLRE